MDYFEKYEKNPVKDLNWNIPEQKQGLVNVVGGNIRNFRAELKTAEYLGTKYPIKTVRLVLPDALQGKLPTLPELKFLKSTESGSFAESEELNEAFAAADYNALMGDLSKNTVTGRAVASACASVERPLLITRDSVDLVAENIESTLLMNENLVLMASLAQLIKLFRAVYYPKMLTLSQSLIQVADALHKFTLSYPVKLVTLHQGQVLIAEAGTVKAIPLECSGYSPLAFWSGEMAAKIIALNLFNPNNFVKATTCAIFA